MSARTVKDGDENGRNRKDKDEITNYCRLVRTELDPKH